MKHIQYPLTRFEIRVAGHLSPQWAEWFEYFTISLEDDGSTRLTGVVVDQAALHGLLKKLRDLGLPLVSVNQVPLDENNPFQLIKGEKMNTNTTHKIDPRTLLSTLWIVVMINMLAADILSLNIPGADELARTAASAGSTIPQLMLGGAIMMEISIAMVLLSRVLGYRINRWANILASLITFAFVIGGGASWPHYLFLAGVEIICLLIIAWRALTWRNPAV